MTTTPSRAPQPLSKRSHAWIDARSLALAAAVTDAHELAVSKLVAGRDKDLSFVRGLVRNRLVETAVLRDRIVETTLARAQRDLCLRRLQAL